MEAIYPVLAWLLTPAVMLGVIGYFSRFFGKIIADQNPFSDDRDWMIEISGFMFTLNLSIGILGVLAALYLPRLSFGLMHAIDIIVVLLLSGIFTVSNALMSAEYYRLNADALKKKEFVAGTIRTITLIGKWFPLWLLPIILGYAGAIEYLSQSVAWIVIVWTSIITVVMAAAMNFSLRKFKDRVPTEIHFVDDAREPIQDALILKVNDDNIRARVGSRIMILNKSEVLKIEFEIPKDRLPKDSEAA